MFTYKFITRGAKNSLKVRIFLNRRMTEISVPGMSVTSDDLANAQSSNPLERNMRLSKTIRQWEAQLSNLRLSFLESKKSNLTLSSLRDSVSAELFGERNDEPEDKTNWERYYEKYVESKTNRSYKISCEQTLVKMRKHCKNFSELTIEDITLKWLRDLDEKMVEEGLSQNSRNIHFKNIRTCLNRAIDDELTNNYPFRRFKIKAEETRKRNLPVEELRRLFDYDVEEYQKYYLDYFKLIFYLIGINGTDLFNLTRIENGRIEYRRAKTHKLYSIK